jgi:putative sterol carrier protein
MTVLRWAASTFAGRGMSNALTDFLAGLAARGHEPLLAKTTGRVCFELSDADGEEPRLVCIDSGHIDVVAGDIGADCTMRASRDTFERVATGDVNAMAAVLRGEIEIGGDWELLVRFQRLFPIAPDRATTPVRAETTSAA